MTDSIPISIPADEEGYVSLRCPHCAGSFKTLVGDLNEFEGPDLYCALCGLSHEASIFLLTPEVNKVIEAEAHNLVADLLNEFSASLERSVRGSKVLKVETKKVDKKAVPAIRAITDLAEAELSCCETRIKVDFSQAASLVYCPFCGQAQIMSASESRMLKAVSLQFRALASAALRSNGDDARVNIRRLLAFVQSTPILRSETERAPEPRVAVTDLWQEARQSRDRLPFPDDPIEELGLLHAMLVELGRNNGEEFWQRCYYYAGKHGMQECVTEVLNDTVGRYCGHLRQVIELALLDSNDPAYDSRRVEVHVTGGTNQLNVAHDQSQLQAQQIIRAESAAAFESAERLLRSAADLFQRTGAAEAEQVEEIARAVVQTLQQAKPSRFTLQSAKTQLETLAAATTVVTAVAPHMGELAVLLGRLLGI